MSKITSISRRASPLEEIGAVLRSLCSFSFKKHKTLYNQEVFLLGRGYSQYFKTQAIDSA